PRYIVYARRMATGSRWRAKNRVSEQSWCQTRADPRRSQRKGRPMKGSRLLVAAVSIAAAIGVAAPPTTGVAATSAPLWVKHVQNFSGGISNGVRFSLDPTVMQAQARYASSVALATTTATSLNNVQMKDD